jgi:F-type H+-transporting ATPase subunit gamma
MAKARAIRKRLKAIKNIRKITRTMELIATARFKKAMDRATAAAAYTRKIAELAADLSHAGADFSHPLLEAHDPSKTGVLLILTSNRGLCGGYNSGVLKQAQQRMRDARERQQPLIIEVSGKRGLNFLKFQKAKYDESYTHFEDKPAFDEVDVLANRFIDLYVHKKIDWVDVAYVKFQSVSRQSAVLERLLPFAQTAEPAKGEKGAHGGGQAEVQYEFLPSAREILEEIVPAAFKARLFKCFLDAAVSEQVARMVAMKGATENAGEIIKQLSQTYNRARQSQITSELSEIIGGAAALG